MSRPRTAVVVAALLLAAPACGGESGAERERKHEGQSNAADRNTCLADAHPVHRLPAGFPTYFPFPPHTVVYNAEDRGTHGVIATGITDLPFKQVLAALNGRAQDAGFRITGGETEEHDAEADWTGRGFRGRWATRESGTCAGETVVQVLATRN